MNTSAKKERKYVFSVTQTQTGSITVWANSMEEAAELANERLDDDSDPVGYDEYDRTHEIEFLGIEDKLGRLRSAK